MQVKLGRYGRFLTCSRFPECDGIKSLLETEDAQLDPEKYVIFDKCDLDGGKMMLKRSKYGTFWACENYPNCKNSKGLMLVETCPNCESHLVERKGKWGRTFIGCSNYPKCKFIKKNESEAKGVKRKIKSTKKKSVSKKK